METQQTEGQPASYEEMLLALEQMVKALEAGGLDLAESLNLYEQGAELAERCRQMLGSAQQRMDVLVQKRNAWERQPFAMPEDEQKSDEEGE